jgi:Recombinational DNA repair protein (RecF pathway)
MSELWDDVFFLYERGYGNRSVIAEMFILENGRIFVIVCGAKKLKSKFFGVLSFFLKLRINYRGRSELKTLSNVEKEEIFCDSFLKFFYIVLYINELLIKIFF